MPDIIAPVIPEYITVHLGPPGSDAENVTVPFIDYIKNVASSEIYPTWPDSALRANIYAIISFALNRVYTEYYRSRGYDFDITNSTQYDQAFVPDRDIFENISDLVDELFNNYIVRGGNIEPLFARFCSGKNRQCDGLSQWGTVDLAEQGLTPYEILQIYYGDDINLVMNAPIADISESYPGNPLKLGDAENNVKLIQTWLNRISRNYPAIPKIAEENGIFGVDTEASVRKFQEVFDLPQTGEVDKSTWYRIRQLYNGVKGLSELVSEGITIDEASVPFVPELTVGMSGEPIRVIQYYLNVIAYFNPALELIPISGVYDPATVNAVENFQRFYGLPVTGIVDDATWDMLSKIYVDTIASVPPGIEGEYAKIYPGYYISQGMEGQAVTDLQTYLNLLGRVFPELPELPVTGYFGEQTRAAVTEFQRLFGLVPTGAVGPVTWYSITNEYNALKDQGIR